MENLTRGKTLIERLVGHLRLDADGYGGPNAGAAETGADLLAAWRSGRVGIRATALDTGAVPGVAVAADTRGVAADMRAGEAAWAPHGGIYEMWGENQLMDATMVRPLVGSPGDWAKP